MKSKNTHSQKELNNSPLLQKIQLSLPDKKILSEISGQNVKLKNTHTKTTEIKDLLHLAQQNATIYLQRNRLKQKLSLLEESNLYTQIVNLQKKLKLKKVPRRIECYDISHLSGKFVYGSMITFLDGNASKKFYRLFKCPNRNDDFLNHKEVLTRRIQRFLKSQQKTDSNQSEIKSQIGWNLPDLIIVDGGKGQLSSDYSVLVGLGVEKQIEMVSLAKKEEEIFYVNSEGNVVSESVLLEGSLKFLVQRIRDEAHRFAITNNRKARLKQASKSKLDEISGVGQKTKTSILQTFGSFDNFLENLESNFELVVELLGEKKAQKIKQKLLKLE